MNPSTLSIDFKALQRLKITNKTARINLLQVEGFSYPKDSRSIRGLTWFGSPDTHKILLSGEAMGSTEKK